MNERGEGGGEGIGVLGCLVVIGLIIWLVKVVIDWLVQLAKWLVEQILAWVIPIIIPVVLVALLFVFRWQILVAHMFIGVLVFEAVRGLLVWSIWPNHVSKKTLRVAIFLYLVVAPSTAAYFIFRGAAWFWTLVITWTSSVQLLRFIFWVPRVIHDTPSFWGTVLALLSLGMIVFGYYFWYFEGDLEDPRHVRLAQEPSIWYADTKLALVDWVTRLILWGFLRSPTFRKQLASRLTEGMIEYEQ